MQDTRRCGYEAAKAVTQSTCVEPAILVQHLIRLVLGLEVATEVCSAADQDFSLEQGQQMFDQKSPNTSRSPVTCKQQNALRTEQHMVRV